MTWRLDASYGARIVSSREIVAKNLRALIARAKKEKSRLSSYQAIMEATAAIGHEVGRSTVDRMSKGTTPFEIDNLEAIAKVFDVEVWQMLTPSFDPYNVPVLRSIGPEEDAAYRKMRESALELAALQGDRRKESRGADVERRNQPTVSHEGGLLPANGRESRPSERVPGLVQQSPQSPGVGDDAKRGRGQ